MMIESDIDIAIEKAKELNYKVQETNYALFITTPISTWWIDFSNIDNIKLWHKNMRINKKRSDKFSEDYHLQKKNFKKVIYALNYIYKHDTYKYTDKEKSKVKINNDKIENIFKKIK